MLVKGSALLALSAGIGNCYVLPLFVQEAFKLNDGKDELLGQQTEEGFVEGFLNANLRPHIPYFLKPQVDSEKLQDKISIDDLNATAWDLYHIAEKSRKKYGHPTRVIGSKGHKKTLEYILDEFEEMKDYYDVNVQHFDALTGKIKSFNLTDSVTGESFINSTALSLSPPVQPFVGRVVHIPNLGCNPEDYKVVLDALNEMEKEDGKLEKRSGEEDDVDNYNKQDKHDKHDKHDKRVKHDKHDDHDDHDKHDKHDTHDKHDKRVKHDKHQRKTSQHKLCKDKVAKGTYKYGNKYNQKMKQHKEKLIALIERGHCSFGQKSELAGRFGFEAVVVYDNDPKATGLHATLEKPNKHTVSTIGVTYSTGQFIIAAIETNPKYSLYFAMDSYVKNIKTTNIIADTKRGDPENIVGLGAHSDSVEEGPGINDDGSGTISLLTVAKQLTHFKITNKVRFAWWSAEEEGLLGSNYYANHLSQEENMKIRLFMDYDMMASPNYEYEIYDANNVDNPKGSEELRDLYIDYYKSKDLNYTLIPFDGRSDYVGFIEHGIPAGGIAAGAEKDNVFNGDVLDKCYHLLCDDVSNLAWDAFLVNTRLIAHSVATYANSLEKFPARVNATVKELGLEPTEQVPLFEYKGNELVM